MLISLNWVREFCPFETGESANEIGVRFSLHTAEVESVVEIGEALRGVRVCEVQTVEPHPDADRLAVVKVSVGEDTAHVVCGAPNVRPGLLVPYAPPGATVSGRQIARAKVRGISSEGMLCSQKELGVSADGAGLWELPAGITPGTALVEELAQLDDVILEVDNKSLTHRPDLWGHYGIAREFSCLYRTPLQPLCLSEELSNASGQSQVNVRFDGDDIGGADGLCRRYCGLEIEGVTVGPSPAWLQSRLLAIGSRPINNIVDVTNYILFELGQPLHAFDTALVRGGEIVVRRAAAGEKLELLDDSTVTLEKTDLVIADGSVAVALAGVMGGAGTEIRDDTTRVFLECANFSPVQVRRTARRLGKQTDSSMRFEKSLDPEMVRDAILRAAQLILDISPGAQVVGPLQDVGYEPAPSIEIESRAKFISNRLGAATPAAKVRETLEQLGFKVKGKTDGAWNVTVPSWRSTKDVSIQEDLVEEVGRIHGYDSIEAFAPQWEVAAPNGNPHRTFERKAKEFLVQFACLHEVFTYSMVGAAHCERFGLDPDAHLRLKNPMSEDLDRMRREIVPLHLEKVKENQRYQLEFGMFEIGRVFRKAAARLRDPELPEELNRLCVVLSFEKESSANFYHARHIALRLLRWLGIGGCEMCPLPPARDVAKWVHPEVAGRLVTAGASDGEEWGVVYRVHPETMRALKLKGDVVAIDLAFDALYERGPRCAIDYVPPQRYPTVPFDVAVVAELRTPVREIRTVIEQAAGGALLEVEVLSVYDELGDGKKSVAFHLVFGSPERTLSGDEVSALQQRVIGLLQERGFNLR